MTPHFINIFLLQIVYHKYFLTTNNIYKIYYFTILLSYYFTILLLYYFTILLLYYLTTNNKNCFILNNVLVLLKKERLLNKLIDTFLTKKRGILYEQLQIF